jgi:peptide/nickel transport system permease protein
VPAWGRLTVLDVVVRRVLSLIPVLFIVTLIAFFVQIAIGGNPAYALAGLTATPGQIHEIERQEHLS